jgi:recombination protein RecR
VRATPAPIERLVAALKRLPGIGEKSATRLAFFLLGAPESIVHELAESIGRLKQEIVLCEICFDLTDASPCAICRDDRRDAASICVVEEPADLVAIERSRAFHGRYHVLGGTLSPIDGVGPEALRIAELEARVSAGGVNEVILATNPNAEGDATAHFISERLAPHGVKATRIAYGMPLGGDLEYADHVTIGRSMENRRSFD